MGLLDRIGNLIRSNINGLVSQAEDPEKILEQAMLDMQEELIQFRQAVAQAIATQKRTERQHTQAQDMANEWYRRAELALQKGEEILAKEALTRRKTYQDTATTMQQQLTQQRTVVDQLKKNMLMLEGKLAEAKTKKDMYIARARSAQASQNLNEMMNRMNPNSATSVFERMEEKVLELEAQSAAVADLGAGDLENRFAALESGNDVDSELAALKARLSTDDPPQLPPS